MATLTWRNVDAPNFMGAAAGYRTSAEMLNNAFDSLRQGLGDFQAQRSESADSAVLANALRFSDPAAYDAALKSGEILGGVNPAHVSREAMQALAGRASTLINDSTNKYNLDRTMQVNAASDAARPALVALAEANASGDPAKIAAVQSQYSQQLAQLPAEEILRTFTAGQGLETGSIRNDGARFDLSTTQRDDADTQAATALVNSIRENNITVDGARQELLAADLTPGARNRATQALNSLFPGMFGPVGSGGAAGGGFAANIPFAETRNYVANITSKAGDITGTNAEKAEKLLPFLIQQESGGKAGAVSPKGAFGLTQLMPATARELEQRLGMEPGQTDRDPEANKAAGKAYLEQMLDKYDGNVEQALAAYNAGPGNVDKWLLSTGNQINAAQGQLGSRVMSNNAAGGAAQDLAANFGSNATVGSVTSDLVKGDFAGADANKVRNQINRIMQLSASEEYGGNGSPSINAAQAGAILQRSIATSNPWSTDGNTGLTSDLFTLSEIGVSDDGIAAAVRAHNSGGSIDAALENQQVAQVSQLLTQAQQASQVAMNDLVQAARRAESQPGARNELPQFKARAQQAQSRVQELLQLQRAAPQFQANRAP